MKSCKETGIKYYSSLKGLIMVKAANHQLFPDFYPSQMPSSHWHNPVMSKSTGGVRVQDREWERLKSNPWAPEDIHI